MVTFDKSNRHFVDPLRVLNSLNPKGFGSGNESEDFESLVSSLNL